MRKVIIDKDGLVINAIEIEEGANWKPPKDCQLLSKARSDKADIGDRVVGNRLIKKPFENREGELITPAPILL